MFRIQARIIQIVTYNPQSKRIRDTHGFMAIHMQGKHIYRIILRKKCASRLPAGIVIVPRFRPMHNHIRIRVHLSHAQGKGVNTPNDFGNIERSHITNFTGFRLHAGDDARKVTHLINASKIGRHILCVIQS